MLPVRLPDGYSLSVLTPADKASLIYAINDPDIYRATLNIPYPYGEAEADTWLHLIAEWTTTNHGTSTSLCIRDESQAVVGGIGFDGLIVGTTEVAEVGYWVARRAWGSGVASAALAAACELGFERFGLKKITAHIFAFNAASQRVLEKNDFHCETALPRHYLKDGVVYDGKLFAKSK